MELWWICALVQDAPQLHFFALFQFWRGSRWWQLFCRRFCVLPDPSPRPLEHLALTRAEFSSPSVIKPHFHLNYFFQFKFHLLKSRLTCVETCLCHEHFFVFFSGVWRVQMFNKPFSQYFSFCIGERHAVSWLFHFLCMCEEFAIEFSSG